MTNGKEVTCPICGAKVKTTQALSGHIRFRHEGAEAGRRELTELEFDFLMQVVRRARLNEVETSTLVGLAKGKRHSDQFMAAVIGVSGLDPRWLDK